MLVRNLPLQSRDVLVFKLMIDGAKPRFGSSRLDRLLQSQFEITLKALAAQTESMLDQLNEQIFKTAEQARSNTQQQALFEAMKALKSARSAYAPAVEEALLAGFHDFRTPHDGERATASGKLSLVAAEVLEEQLICDEIRSRAEIRQSQSLWALGQRYGVLIGKPAIDQNLLPVGPHALIAAFKAGMDRLPLAVDVKVQAYRLLEKKTFNSLDHLYDQLNDHFRESKVLPELKFEARTRAENSDTEAPAPNEVKSATTEVKSPPTEARSAQADVSASETGPPVLPPAPQQHWSAAAARAMPVLPAAAHVPGTHPQHGSIPPSTGLHGRARVAAPTPPVAHPAPAATAAQAPMPDFASRLPPSLAALLAPYTREPEGGSNDGQPQPVNAERTPGSAADAQRGHGDDARLHAETFSTLRELLGGRKRLLKSFGAGGGRSENATVAPTEDLQSVLSALRSRPISHNIAGQKRYRSIAQVRQDLMQQLAALSPDQRPELSDVDNDTFDLVGMLFDYLDRDTQDATRGLLAKLQIPVLQVALRDKSFFGDRHHPARALMSAITEAGQLWDPNDEADAKLLKEIDQLVEHVHQQYDGDLSLFDRLLKDLAEHLQVVTRKAQVSERRHVEAARGRERLEQAQGDAEAEIGRIINDHNPPKFLLELLETSWADVLALRCLRHGRDGEEFKQTLNTAAVLASSLRRDLSAEARHKLRQVLPGALADFKDGLTQIGVGDSEQQKVLGELKTCQDWALHEGPTKALPAQINRSPSVKPKRLADDGGQAKKKEQAKLAPLTDREKKTVEWIKTLPFGSWFEFEINQQKAVQKRKLAWYSPVSGRCLFVNARGVRIEERPVDLLARDIERGTVRLAQANEGSMVDRAFKTIMSTLRQIVGRPAEATV